MHRTWALPLSILIGIFCAYSSCAQVVDSQSLKLVNDSLSVSIDTVAAHSHNGFIKQLFRKGDYPNPTKAVVFSLLVPGAGQAYNKKYWKIPIVYGVLGGLYFAYDYQNGWYQRYDAAWELKKNGQIHEFSSTAIDSEEVLLRRRNAFRKNRELMTILFVVGYLLNGMDAYVDAHLLDFDISDDLSLRLAPHTEQSPGLGTSAGLTLVFELP